MDKHLSKGAGLNKMSFFLGFWNIHGQKSQVVGDKLLDADFLQVCQQYDVIGLAELHTELVPSINGFKLIKQKIRKKTHKGPKISGRIAVFAKNEISHMVDYVPSESEDTIWVKIKTNEHEEKFIATVYISSYTERMNKTPLETLFEEARSFSPRGDVIIQGDLNARTGNLPDYIVSDKSDELFGVLNNEKPSTRNSQDGKTCTRGSRLLDLCQAFDFLILNGRKTGDIFGKCTSFQWNGSSVVDYVISPASSFDIVTTLEVGS